MRSRRYNRNTLLGLFFLVFSSVDVDTVDAEGLSLLLLPDTDKIVAGEPLYVQVAIRNTSLKEQSVRTTALQEWQLFVAYESDGYKQARVEAIEASGGAGARVSLAPSTQINTSFLWSRRYASTPDGVSQSLFPRAGQYQLRLETNVTRNVTLPAELKDSNDLIAISDFMKANTLRLMSNVVMINVTKGNDDDREGRELYTHERMADWIESGTDRDLYQIGSLNHIIRVSQHSPFTDHAHLRLAEFFESKAPHRLSSGLSWDDDNVWLAEPTKLWVVDRVMNHYMSVSDHNQPLQARSIYAAGMFAIDHSKWLPADFDVQKLLVVLETYSEFADSLALKPYTAEQIRSRVRHLQLTLPKPSQ